MEAIYASKLYKASNRKDRIQAALLAPGNLSLVQQLAEDLDEPYQTPENLGQVEEAEPEVEEEENDLIVDEEVNPETDLVTMDDVKAPASSGGGHVSPPSSQSKPESKDSEGNPKADTSDLIPESPANEQQPKEPAEASTKVRATTVSDLNILKGTLNNREDTTGVSRIAEKDNEVWIYYNDDINLNDIMTNVIECLMDSEYENFEFNRLARSDNAIVFVKEKTDTIVENNEDTE